MNALSKLPVFFSLISLFVAFASSASAVDYTLSEDGAINDNTKWTGGPPAYDFELLDSDDDLLC